MTSQGDHSIRAGTLPQGARRFDPDVGVLVLDEPDRVVAIGGA
jgi:hypothetical protein